MSEGPSGCARERPRLSIIIPTYNRLAFLSETLDHLLNGLDESVEVIVVDDASTDGTAAWIRTKYGQRVMLICSDVRQGPSGCRNLGLDCASGRHFMPLDSDCFIVHDSLVWLLERLAREPETNLLLACRSWPDGKRSVIGAHDRIYTARDIILKTYGEVIPVLCTDSLQQHGLRFPRLFAGGEPLLVLELSRHVSLHFKDKIILEYRTDVAMRISSAEYQLAHSRDIADVFRAYLPYLEGALDPDLVAERYRVLEKVGIYESLAGGRDSVDYLLAAIKGGRRSAILFLILTFFPVRARRGLFRLARWVQAALASAARGRKGGPAAG